MSAYLVSELHRLEKKLKSACMHAQKEVAKTALEDANAYCRYWSGELVSSSKNSRLEKGLLIWDTPYARRVYYLGTPNKRINPNASILWAHKAAAIHGKQWRNKALSVIKGEISCMKTKS